MSDHDYIREKLTEFVRVPSTPDVDRTQILRAAEEATEDLGLRPIAHEDAAAVEASSGSGGVLFNGHLDTVPLASGWTKEQGSWEGDFLYGRGAADMKAGCVAALAAARDLLERGVPFSLLFTTDEETTMRGAKMLAPTRTVRDAAAIVVAEPSALRVIVAEKGVLWYRATTRGRSAHGSTPHLGDNAIHRMARVLPHLARHMGPEDAEGGITVNVGGVRGGVQPNLVADYCTLDLDCRHPPGTSRADVEDTLRKAIAASGETVDLDLFHEIPPASVSPEAPHVRALRDIARAEVIQIPYGTEMAYYARENPRCVVFGPGDPASIHGPDEGVSLAQVARAAEIFTEYAVRLAPGRVGQKL